MPTVEPYRKLDITRYIAVISKLREMGFLLTKEQELRAANIPFDETEDALLEGPSRTGRRSGCCFAGGGAISR